MSNHEHTSAVSQPTGDLTDEQIDRLLVKVGPTAGIYKDSRDLSIDKLREFARTAIAAHLAQQPEAEQPAGDQGN
jgi:hypothetical protein